jgi:phosphoribosyl 1,2-cyclic phosphate phosphodiesterase
MVYQIEKIIASHHVSSGPVQITLLGTGTSQGIPVIGCRCKVCASTDQKDKRLRTSAFIQIGDIGLLIDIGPDFRAQMLANQLDDIHAILVTHEHNDHVSGLDDIRPVNFIHQRDMPVYCSARTLTELEKRFYYAFDPAYQYPGKPRVHGIPIDGLDQLIVEGVPVKPILVDHGGLDVFGFRIGRLAYITDAKTIPENSMNELMGLDVLVLNALRVKSHVTHLNIEEAVDICGKLKPKQCFLTHISHDMGCHADVNKLLPPNIRLGYDGQTIKLT